MRKNSRSSNEGIVDYIYYILLENRKFYIASYKTKVMTIDDIKATSALSGPDWLLINRPMAIIKIIESNPLFSMEDYVINYMSIEGIQNVRGSIYINSYISSKTESLIKSKMKRTYVSIDCGDYVEDSDSETSSKTSSESSSSSDCGIISRAYRWFCFKKIKNNESKVSLID